MGMPPDPDFRVLSLMALLIWTVLGGLVGLLLHDVGRLRRRH